MQGEYTTDVTFNVRVLTLRQLADLWSMVMSFLPEVIYSAATFKRQGRSTEHEYRFRDADELARTTLDFRPGELTLGSIHISSPDVRIFIREGWASLLLDVSLALPTNLKVEIIGSNEAEVLKLRSAIRKWGEGNVDARPWALWCKLGGLAAGTIGAWAGAALLGFSALTTLLAVVGWLVFFTFLCLAHGSIPARYRWSTRLRIVPGAPPRGSGPGGGAPGLPDPSPFPGVARDEAGKPSVEHS